MGTAGLGYSSEVHLMGPILTLIVLFVYLPVTLYAIQINSSLVTCMSNVVD